MIYVKTKNSHFLSFYGVVLLFWPRL